MKYINFIIELNNTLAEWDPIGVAISDPRLPYSEYIFYIPAITREYFSGTSTYDSLLNTGLLANDSKEQMSAIRQAADKLSGLFFSLTEDDKTLILTCLKNQIIK